MNSSRILFAVAASALFFTLALFPVRAGGMGNGAAQRMKLVVDSIDATGGTIVLKSGVDNSVHPYKITAATRVMVGNVKGSIDQIQPGQKVANLSAEAGAPPQVLKFLQVSPAAAAPTNP